MPQPIVGSSETNTRPRGGLAQRGHRAHHRRRAAGVDRHRIGGARVFERARERRGHAAALAARAVLGGEMEPCAKVARTDPRSRGPRPIGRRRTGACACRAPPARRPAWQTARGRRRRRPSTPRPAGPPARTAVRAARGRRSDRPASRRTTATCRRPTRLFRRLSPAGSPAASRSRSKIENGRRSSGSSPGRGLTMTNCPGCAARAISGAFTAMTL